jgi:peptidyl-prolyl cis-trans isomerase D
MAVLERIRSKGVLLIVVIGLALLAFVVSDFLHSGSSYFNKSQSVVAKINGEEIDIKDFNAAVEQMTEVYKIETGKAELNEQMTSELRNQVWEMIVNEKILNKEVQKLGLAVSVDELSDRCFGKNVHPLIMQRRGFAGKDGRFSKEILVKFLKSLEQTPSNEEMRQQIASLKNYWSFWEKTVKNSILQEKYAALMSKVSAANNLEAKMSFEARKFSVDASYVLVPYFKIPESAVQVSDDEIKTRYNNQKELYKQDANCSMNIVQFDVKPLKEDYDEAKKWMDGLTQEFKTTDDVAGLVNSNSDVMYDGRKYSPATVPTHLKGFAFGGKTGDIYGPVFANDTYTMARIMESGISTSDSVKIRHIFLLEKDAAKADSIIAAVKGGANFGDLARKYSAVKESAEMGGELGWIVEGMPGMDKSINVSFDKSAGEIFTLKNAQGVQILQVVEKTAPRSKVKLAILERKVTPSAKSNSKIFNEAKAFAAGNNADEFEARAKAKKYYVRPVSEITKSMPEIQGIAQSRQVIRWCFKSSKNDVSDVFECGNQFVVAITTEVNAKGYRSLDKVKESIKSELVKEKKADVIIKDIASKNRANSNIQDLAKNLQTDVKIAPAVNFSSLQFGPAGVEPAVIGKLANLEVNQLSSPIKGISGVFVISTTNKVVNPQAFNLQMELSQLNSRKAYSLPYMMIQDLREKADIEDNRINLF